MDKQFHASAEALMQPLKNATIRMMLEAGVLDFIAKRPGEHVSAKELAEKTGYDELLIGKLHVARLEKLGSKLRFLADFIVSRIIVRLMRLITLSGVCAEVGDRAFDLFFPIGACLMDYMHETGFHQFPAKSDEKSPFEYAHKSGFFEFFEKNRDQRKYFDDFMSIRREGLVVWHETYPIADQLGPGADTNPEAVMLVDVGGGWGHDLKSLFKTHPGLSGRLILQDLPIIIGQVQSRSDTDGFELMSYDIFTPQPVKGARAYYFHNICHDWPDTECIRFLTNTAKSMKKGYSRLLIDDYVLPNIGAPDRGSSMDILMMMFCSGMERTVRQWQDLLDACGLEITRIWNTRSDYESVIDAQLKE
ncbi:hypothetical protein LTR47_009747 [Exophiala xenobiotica]|nr:hypothetical protein LTR72_010662 [Exophiala xenobiotica]KAK5224312.1 hypothetical protein LTR47_009747 [Exophiala xenobiotica]KAK5247728.1 hypothetical protein LTS06_007121 [Exophiala xenobiotica]KAK5345814.1 hypothetical protein LTR61_010366 [Exophiala xenobiotica]KAK5477940.1 hypothetical protein LTR55_007923 [Exophiala xenobiotica]